MKFIAESISDFIISQINRLLRQKEIEANEMRLMLPSLPGPVVLSAGQSIREYCLHQASNKVKFVYKTAYALGREWKESDDPNERAAFEQLRQEDWYDDENHLTQYRNIKRDSSEEDVLIIVLVGYDRLTDQSSLADFFRLDNETVWKQCLNSNFSLWLESWLTEAGVEAEDDQVERMDKVLKALVNTSLADLAQVSSFIENLNLSTAQDGRDVFLLILQNLDRFYLPNMRGLAAGKKIDRVSTYFSAAIEFFNYSQFIDQPRRKRALKIIDEYIRDVEEEGLTEDIDPDNLGKYHNIVDLGTGLKKYVERNDTEERLKLLSVDFVFLTEEILAFKKPKVTNGAEIKKPKKLYGMPLEVILKAVWVTLGEFKAWTLEKGLLATEAITNILIQGELFKHDCEGDNQEELKQNAGRQLVRIIGGLDQYLEDQLSFAPDLKNNPERNIQVNSSLCPPLGEDILAYERTTRAEPYLKFSVRVSAGDEGVRRAFIWRFPQTHPYQNMTDMFSWIYKKELSTGSPLPLFSIPYLEELMLAKGEDEVNRILQIGLQNTDSRHIYNLLEADGIDQSDKVVPRLKSLAYEYGLFIKEAYEKGVFTAMNRFIALLEAYRIAYKTFLKDQDCIHSQLGPLLFKAFCVLGERTETEDSYWMWQRYEPAMIVTPLHPALLEMMYHQHAYLCESFEVAARQGLRESNVKLFSERRWADIEDLARIQWPLHGTLRNEEQILDTNVRSFGLTHLIGESPQQEATLTTRLLLRYDMTEEEEINDEDIFQETRESRLISRVLGDYRALHPHADDGITIAAYCSGNVQPVIAGVDSFLSNVFEDRDENRIYTLSITFFVESQDDTAVTRWVNEWRDRWQAVELSKKLSHYSKCRISVAHRMITRERNYALLRSLISKIDLDVAFLLNFILAGASGNRFAEITPYDHSHSFRMFPVLEKSCCSVIGGGLETVRERIISNRQFLIGTLHSEVMARMKGYTHQGDNEYVVMGRGDFAPWIGVVDELHKRSAWVVCIDPSVDEKLISKQNQHGVRQREIIGFGSGVGLHGEQNYTVSTEFFSLSDVKTRISSHVCAKLGPWDRDTCDAVAASILKEAMHMAGMSLVRATGPSQYVRDFIGFALVRKLLPQDPTVFCDEVISLDAFRHWFDSALDSKRPDLLRLKATIKSGVFYIDAQLLECKLAHESERHLEKAREQLESGLRHLISCFRPRALGKVEGVGDRPDQRYWWLQLHRLIASKGQVSPPDLEPSVAALEQLSEGFFCIEWKAAAITFWTDSDSDEIQMDGEWEFLWEDSALPIYRISAGRNFIKVLCTEKIKAELPLGAGGISLSSIDEPKREERGPFEKSVSSDETERAKPGLIEDAKVPEQREASEVLRDSKKVQVSLMSSAISIPERIFLGKGINAGRAVYWEFGHSELPNRHILIFGTSGMGKTYTIQALLCELGRYGQNSLIVDYTNGFEADQIEKFTDQFLRPKQHRVQLDPLPINPFRQQKTIIGGKEYPEKSAATAMRIMSVFASVYGLGDQQKSALYQAIKDGVDAVGGEMKLDNLVFTLNQYAEKGYMKEQALSLLSKIVPFVDGSPFGPEHPDSWKRLYEDKENKVHVVQLVGCGKEFSKLITEFTLIDLYWFARGSGTALQPKVIVLDEIQNLDHTQEGPIANLLTEGRKFGIALILATQTLSNLGKDERDRLFQASHKLFFKPADTEIRSHAQILENATGEKAETWTKRLALLKKGECYSLGPSLNTQTGNLETKAFRIRIDSLESRFNS
jgi:DNA phosphorothioation-dependent restriction protein DptH